MNPFVQRQIMLIAAVVVALLVAASAGFYSRLIMIPVVWGPPFYINPIYWFPFLFYGAIGLFTVFRSDDHAWPWFVTFAGIWILLISFEDSIIQWFTIQQGIGTIGGRVNPIGISASAVAMGAAILLHVNQLGRRLRNGFADRGLDPRELRQVEEQAWRLGLANVISIGGMIAIASVVLWIGGFALGRTRVGIGELGILGGLLILSVIAVMTYRLLLGGAGPVGDLQEEELAPRRRGRPPRGFR